MKTVETMKQILKKALSKTNFTDQMQDMNGEWFYSESAYIEADLGCTIGLYDWMKESLYYLEKLSEMGIHEVTLSIKDTCFFEQAYRMAEW